MSIEWENVDWSNTHMDVSDGQYHLGTIDTPKGRFVVIAVGADAEAQMMALNSDDVDEFFKWVRTEAKSL
jgi:hypothetical protein